ncbi:MAG: hypothetical protein ACRYHA_27750 [Janthinobacterium lividum]
MKTYFAPAIQRFLPMMLVLLAGMSCGITDAVADADPGLFTVSGFATLGATHSSNQNADYTSTFYQPTGAGYSHRYDVDDDTKVGIQLGAQFTNQLSAVVQVVTEYRDNNRFTPAVEWANIRYAFTPNFSVRLGRVELPTFFSADVRDVGFANPWVRPPLEVYSINPVTNSDGVDFSYRLHAGAVSNTLRLLYGDSVFHISPGEIRVAGDGILGLFDTIEYRDITAHLGYERATISVTSLPGLPVRGYSAGVLYDPGRAFVQAELSRMTADTLTPGYISGYVTVGYRVRKFTPYVTFAREFSMGRPVQSTDHNTGQNTWSIGTRWDVANNVDLKLQFDHVSMPAGSYGLLFPKSTTYQLGSGANVLSVCLDFVF